MKVTLHLHTTLQQPSPAGPVGRLEVTLPTGSSLADLLSSQEIELDEENTLLVVNGRLAEMSQLLADGDVVHLIPAISGGR